MMKQMKVKVPVVESNINFNSNVGKKRTQKEAYLDDIEKINQSARKKKQRVVTSDNEHDLVTNKEIRSQVKKVSPTKPIQNQTVKNKLRSQVSPLKNRTVAP